jgi:hypothetical protein
VVVVASLMRDPAVMAKLQAKLAGMEGVEQIQVLVGCERLGVSHFRSV